MYVDVFWFEVVFREVVVLWGGERVGGDVIMLSDGLCLQKG